MITSNHLRRIEKKDLMYEYKMGNISKYNLIQSWPDDPFVCSCGWEHVSVEYADIDFSDLSLLCPECESYVEKRRKVR